MPLVNEAGDEVSIEDAKALAAQTDSQPSDPSLGETVGAAFASENVVGSTLASETAFLSEEVLSRNDPDFDAISDIAGTHYEAFAHRFARAQNPTVSSAIKADIDRELKNRQILDSAGWTGTIFGVGAAIFDLPSLLPGGTLYKSGKLGFSAVKSSASVGSAAAAATAAQELALHSTQQTRTPEQSAVAIGGSLLLGGILGAGTAKFLTRSEYKEFSAAIDRLNELDDDVFAPGGIGVPGSAGAAVARAGDNKLKSALGGEKVFKFQDPTLRLATGPSIRARQINEDLTEPALVMEKAARGEAQGPGGPVETRIKMWQAPLSDALEDLDDAYSRYFFGASEKKFAAGLRGEIAARLGRTDRLGYSDFKAEVGKAMRRGDKHEIQEVADAAKKIRQKVYDPLEKAAIEVKIFDEGVDVKTADSYLNRIYNHERIIARRPEFKRIVAEWLQRTDGKEASEANSRADEIIDRILGTPAGRLPYDVDIRENTASGASADSGLSGPLRRRKFNIPDNLIEEFLENDVEVLSRTLVRSVAPDIELVRKFGDVKMTAHMKEVADEFNVKAERATSEKARNKLEKAKSAAIRDLDGIRRRLRNTYALPENPEGIMVRSARVMRSLNYLRLLGGQQLSSIPDIGKPIGVHGLTRVMGDGFVPMVRNFRSFRLAAKEVKSAGTALDMVLDSRTMAIADVMDDYGRGSRFERGLQKMTTNFGVISVMAPWNAAIKQFTGIVTMSRFLQNAETALRTGSLPTQELEKMASMGIDVPMAQRIATQFEKHGELTNGVYLPNTALWTDRGAIEALRSGIVRDVDRAIVTPGQDKPLMMSTELGKLIGQFKSFQFASTQRTLLSGLQQRDLAALNGALLMLGLGYLRYAIGQWQIGRKPSVDPRVAAAEAFDRSGLGGWLMEPHNVVAKWTAGNVSLSGRPLSRYASRGAVAAALGPSVGMIEDAGSAAGHALIGEFSASDIKKMRRLYPYQNLYYLRWLFDQVQDSAIESVDPPEL